MKHKKFFSIIAVLMLAVMIAAVCFACNPKQSGESAPEAVNATELSNSIKGTVSAYIAGDCLLDVNQMEYSFINKGVEGFANNLSSAGFYKSKAEALVDLIEYIMIVLRDSSNSAKLDMYEGIINQALELGLTQDDIGVIVESLLNAFIDLDVDAALAETEEKALAYLSTVSQTDQEKYANYAKLANIAAGIWWIDDAYTIDYYNFEELEDGKYSSQDYNTIKGVIDSTTDYTMEPFATLEAALASGISFSDGSFNTMVGYVGAVIFHYYNAACNDVNADYNNDLFNAYDSAVEWLYNSFNDIEDAFFKNNQKIAQSGLDELTAILNEYKLINTDTKIVIPQNASEVTAAWFVSTRNLVMGELSNMYYKACPYEGYRNAKMLQWKVAYYKESVAKTPEDGTQIVTAEELRTTFVPTLKALAVECFNVVSLASNVTTNIVNIAESKFSASDVESILGTTKQSIASVNNFFANNNEMINNALSTLGSYYKVKYNGFNTITLDLGLKVKDIKSIVNSMPAITKLLTVAIDSLDADILQGMFEVTKEDAITENFAIYAARLLNNLLTNMSQQDALDIALTIFEHADARVLYSLYEDVWDEICDSEINYYVMSEYVMAQLSTVIFEDLMKKDKDDDVVETLMNIYNRYDVGVVLEDLTYEGGANDFKNVEKLSKYFEKLVEKVATSKNMAKLALESAIKTLYAKLESVNEAATALVNLTPVTSITADAYTTLVTSIVNFEGYIKSNFYEDFSAEDTIYDMVDMISNYINEDLGLGAPYDFSTATVIEHGQTVSETYDGTEAITKIYKFTPSQNMTLRVVTETHGWSNIYCCYIKGDYVGRSISDGQTYGFELLAGFDYYIVIDAVSSNYSIAVEAEELAA